MRGVNKCIFIGNLGMEPDTKYLPDGTAVTTFNMAVSETYKDKNTGDQKEATEWITVESWGRLAEICAEHLTKGQQVFVEGKYKTDTWQDKDTGDKRYRTKIRADQVQFLGKKSNAARPMPNLPVIEPEAAAPSPKQDEFDDDIPF
jgi:single-strand DNA-binding protein